MLVREIMRKHKIGCLPVLDGPELVGLLTGMDLLDAIILLTGVTKPSSRLEVDLDDKPGELARLTALLAARHVNIYSILTYPATDQTDQTDQTLRTVLRLGTNQVRPLAEDLRKENFSILWPLPKPWQS